MDRYCNIKEKHRDTGSFVDYIFPGFLLSDPFIGSMDLNINVSDKVQSLKPYHDHSASPPYFLSNTPVWIQLAEPFPTR